MTWSAPFQEELRHGQPPRRPRRRCARRRTCPAATAGLARTDVNVRCASLDRVIGLGLSVVGAAALCALGSSDSTSGAHADGGTRVAATSTGALYYSAASGSVLKAPLAGGTGVPVAQQAAFGALAGQDQKYIYTTYPWGSDGAPLKIMK